MASLGDDVSQWMAAGAKSLLMNSPISPNRFEDLAAAVADRACEFVVDFGCGRGAFPHRIAELTPVSTIIGVDTSTESIEHAQAMASESGLSDRLRFENTDALTWSGVVDSAVCIGSSHALGGPRPMFERLRDLGATHAVIGDGFWQQAPDDWCLENLGEMPLGATEIRAIATEAGWVVDELDASTLDEWDAFERLWTQGVRSVGTPGATAFADQRTVEYQRYRGVLGFAWLQLSRSA